MDNEIWQRDRVAWQLFEYLLFRAYSDKSQPLGKLVTTRQQMAQACFGNSSTIYKALKRLEKAKMVTTSVTTKYTLVSICNWENYQGNGNSSGNNKVTTKEQQSNSLIRNKNKENRNTITNVIGEPVYGNTDINLIVDVFEKAIGKQPRAAKQRQAAQTLKQRHGVDRVLKAIEFYTQVRGTPYSPNIATLEDLRDKWINLETFAGKKISSKPKGIIQI